MAAKSIPSTCEPHAAATRGGAAGNNLRWKHARVMELMATYQKENMGLSQRLQELEVDHKVCKSELEAERSRGEEAALTITKLQQDMKGLEEQYSGAKSLLPMAEMADNLQRQVATLVSEKDRLQGHNDLLRRDVADAQLRIETLEKRVKSLDFANRALEGEKERLEREAGEAEDKLWDVEKERDVLRLEKSERGKALEEGMRVKEGLQEEISSLEERVESLRGQVEELTKEKREWKSAVRMATEGAAAQCNKVERLGKELEEERSRMSTLTGQYAAEKEEWERKSEDAEDKLHLLEEQLKNRSHFAEFLDIKMEKRHLISELEKTKSSQEQLRRALAMERHFRRGSGSGSGSGSSILRDQENTIIVGHPHHRRGGSMPALMFHSHDATPPPPDLRSVDDVSDTISCRTISTHRSQF